MSSVVIAGDTSGSVTLQAPATAGSVVVTLPSTSGTMVVGGTTPTLSTLTVSGDSFLATASGNVGIGTASPTTKLQVNGIINSNSDIQNSSDNVIYSYNGSTPGTVQAGIQFVGSGQNIRFNTAGTERMRITSGYQVLIGTGTPTGTGTFQVNGSLNTGNAARIGLTSLGGGSSGGDYPSVGYNMSFTAGSTINYLATDLACWIKYGSGIQTFTAPSGTAGNAISATSGPYVAIGGTSWTNTSDERLKNITGEITGALDKVGQLRAAKYTWKRDETNAPQVGLIAQDLLKVLPEVVVVPTEEFDKEGNQQYLGVNYDSVVPLLVAAIKELKAEVDALKAGAK